MLMLGIAHEVDHLDGPAQSRKEGLGLGLGFAQSEEGIDEILMRS